MNDQWTVDDDVVARIVERVKKRFSMKPKVAFAGFGKCGKSSLFNAIYGAKVASVSMKTDETTPDNMSTRERFGIDFTDTPGFGTEKFSLDTVGKLLEGQHVVVHLLNGTAAISSDDHRLHEILMQGRAKSLSVVNKADLLGETEKSDVTGSMKEQLALDPDQFLFVSAKRGTNVAELVRRITALLPDAMRDAFIAQQQADMDLKQRRVRTLIYSKATLAAVIGAIPIPIADIFILTPLQIAMVTSIGYLHGVEVSEARVAEFMVVMGAGMGLRELARQLFKLIPGWGSAISAAIAFAGTVALGEAANAWFKSDMKMPPEELHEVFKKAAENAKAEYQSKKTSAPASIITQVAVLQRKREAGEISDNELATALGKIDTDE
jgi:small GTP-binding protein